MVKEPDIVHDRGTFWVLKEPHCYNVLQSGPTHSLTLVQFAPTEDGKSLAIACCDYKADRAAKEVSNG